MRRSLTFPRFWLTFGLLLGGLPCQAPPASAQIRIPEQALVDSAADSADVSENIRQGEQLERERKWSEAAIHYERSLKDHPGRPELQQRLTRARTFVDLKRRYSDSSFTAALAKVTPQQALDEYSEVLLKIETYHVKTPAWSAIVQRGATNLHYALDSVEFRARNMSEIDVSRISAFREWLGRSANVRAMTHRLQAREAVAKISAEAQRQLGLPPNAAIFEFTCGAAAGLDRYSSFLTAGQLDELFSQIEGNFVGLGVELRAADEVLEIVSVIPNSPAEMGGVHAGDKIVEVDGKATSEISLDAAADMLKGPEGSQVEVTLLSPTGQRRGTRLVRRRVEIPSVENARILDAENGIAYLRLTSFQKTTYREVKDTLWKLYRDGMKSLIFDVRGNPGGLLAASVEVADLFVSEGSIVSTRGRSPREDFDHKAHVVGTWRVPLIVLIDEDTASASEIFAAAIRDHKRGEVVGQTSYGKGSVQGIFPLSISKAGVRLTTAKFFSPNGQAISNRGVSPSVPVVKAAKPAGNDASRPAENRDEVLDASLQLARQRISPKQISSNQAALNAN